MIDGKIIHRKLNKMPYSGSYQGMRFYLTAKEEQIEAYVYPEPFCMEKTPDDQKIHRQFPFNEEGFEQVTGLSLIHIYENHYLLAYHLLRRIVLSDA